MNITEVNIKLTKELGERLQAFCSITFDDCFVIRDLKIIEGSNGPFVAMPSRKLAAHCPQCNSKNHLRASYCNQCGLQLDAEQNVHEQEGRAKLYADIAHPINSECREMIQERVIEEFLNEVERSRHPGYSSGHEGHREEERVAGAVVEQKSSEPGPIIHIDSATSEPRCPHNVPSETPTLSKPTTKDRNGGFGAGIF